MPHRLRGTATHTAGGEPRGYIKFSELKQLWIHTGTTCNLSCPSCFEHARPGDQRIEAVQPDEVAGFMERAANLNVQSFGFTGGEPFTNPGFVEILETALKLRPCLVLSNGTAPLRQRLAELGRIVKSAPRHDGSPLTIRISLDYPDAEKHDAGRGKGCFDLALDSLKQLHDLGISIAVARRLEGGEDSTRSLQIADEYKKIFRANDLPENTAVVAFPNLEDRNETPEISENCIRTYQTPESCAKFMCAHTRMLVKQKGKLALYSCTLVDDDPAYNLGSSLQASLEVNTLLRHKRCFACFASGVSCGG